MKSTSMRRKLPSLLRMKTLEAAIRCGSFMAAAAELAVTQSSVSHQIRKLEEELGVKLFVRGHRRVQPTAQAMRFYVILNRAFSDIEHETSLISHNQKQSLTIRITSYPATRWLSPRLNDFLIQNPDIVLRLEHPHPQTPITVDGVDLAISWGTGNWDNVESHCLLKTWLGPVCSQSYANKIGGLDSVTSLKNSTLILESEEDDLWNEWLTLAGVQGLNSRSQIVIVDPNVRIQAVLDGQGIALADNLVTDELDAGRLIRPFEETLDRYCYYLIWSTERKPSPESQRFLSWISTTVQVES